jgi:predicted MFS family arabinose efflux permease
VRVIVALVRDNRNFRLLWLGQIVSQLGDWFNYVALYALLFELTASATVVASLMVVQILPIALVGPSAGVIVDRFDRRRIMIAADVIRGLTILGLLFVRSASMVWLAYVVTGVTVAASGFFEPARSATVPLIVRREDLVSANAVSTGTWSAMLAIGGSLGGLVAATLGRDAAFLINSLSFFLSAICLWQLRVPPRTTEGRAAAGWHGLVEGVEYMRSHWPVARVTFVKGGWAIVGGALLLLTVFGDRVFRLGDSGDAGIGVLYAARGVGAAIGSFTVTALARRSGTQLIRWIAPSYLAAGIAYATLGLAPTIWVAALTVVVAHTFGSILWVASNVLLQLSVPDLFRGRVFAAELMTLSVVQAFFTVSTALALDRLHASPRTLAFVIGACLLVPAVLWRERRRRHPESSGRNDSGYLP